MPGQKREARLAPGDPGIHPVRKNLAKVMDCRVKPGNDDPK
jgi:hypothetical protein